MPVERREQVIAVGIGSTGNGTSLMSDGRRQPSSGDTSRMTRECQVRICEGLEVKFLGPTRQYLGDGVLVYFGYPQAHEDDVERAVRAGLELIAATTGLKTTASLQIRVGCRFSAGVWGLEHGLMPILVVVAILAENLFG
jgi:class 3 adenylate cyclase